MSANVPSILIGTRALGIAGTGVTLNAVGESAALIGYVELPAKTGTKTISSSGGKIYWNTASGVVWADVGTAIDVGIQDVAATGLEDGTFDVKGTLVPGTETIASNTLIKSSMETGTKDLTHGQLIAIVIEMTARGGADVASVDRIAPNGFPMGGGIPYGTADTGTLAKGVTFPTMMIEFDDGTFGWISFAGLRYNTAVSQSTISFNSGSTPDEYCGAFQIPTSLTIDSIGFMLAGIATTDDFEAILYSDPFGTPVATVTVVVDPDQLNTGEFGIFAITPTTLAADTWYAAALRPTTANNITWSYFNLTSGLENLKNIQFFKDSTGAPQFKMASRSNQTGAFTETNTFDLPDIAIGVCTIITTGGAVNSGGYGF